MGLPENVSGKHIRANTNVPDPAMPGQLLSFEGMCENDSRNSLGPDGDTAVEGINVRWMPGVPPLVTKTFIPAANLVSIDVF